MSARRIHPTAEVESGVELGEGVSIWSNVHIRGPDTEIGAGTTIGEKTYIAYGVRIGRRVKINAFVYICTGVTIEDGVMVSSGATFTNDRFPRATTSDLQTLRPSEPDDNTEFTTVRAGATIGAGAVIGPGLEIGSFAMVGMGSVVTHDVPSFHLVVGNPARTVGFLCKCGHPLPCSSNLDGNSSAFDVACVRCGLGYTVTEGTVLAL